MGDLDGLLGDALDEWADRGAAAAGDIALGRVDPAEMVVLTDEQIDAVRAALEGLSATPVDETLTSLGLTADEPPRRRSAAEARVAAAEWAEQQSGTLITRIEDRARQEIRDRVAQAVRELAAPRAPARPQWPDRALTGARFTPGRSWSGEAWNEALARRVRPWLGLDARREAALGRYRDDLLAELDAGRRARRRPTDRPGRARVRSEDQVERLVERYGAELRRQRARTVAATESHTAVQAGRYATWRAAAEHGRGPALLRWVTTADERMCGRCGGMSGQLVRLGEPFVEAPPVAAPAGRPALSGEEAVRRADADGGFSLRRTSLHAPTSGVMVARWPDRSLVIDDPHAPGAARRIDEWIAANRDLLDRPGNYVGAWRDPDTGKLWLDVSRRYPQSQAAAAVRAGRRANQIAVWDLDRAKEIPTGGTGQALVDGGGSARAWADLNSSPRASRIVDDGGGPSWKVMQARQAEVDEVLARARKLGWPIQARVTTREGYDVDRLEGYVDALDTLKRQVPRETWDALRRNTWLSIVDAPDGLGGEPGQFDLAAAVTWPPKAGRWDVRVMDDRVSFGWDDEPRTVSQAAARARFAEFTGSRAGALSAGRRESARVVMLHELGHVAAGMSAGPWDPHNLDRWRNYDAFVDAHLVARKAQLKRLLDGPRVVDPAATWKVPRSTAIRDSIMSPYARTAPSEWIAEGLSWRWAGLGPHPDGDWADEWLTAELARVKPYAGTTPARLRQPLTGILARDWDPELLVDRAGRLPAPKAMLAASSSFGRAANPAAAVDAAKAALVKAGTSWDDMVARIDRMVGEALDPVNAGKGWAEAGGGWYGRWGTRLEQVADALHVPRDRFTAMAAAMSQNNAWSLPGAQTLPRVYPNIGTTTRLARIVQWDPRVTVTPDHVAAWTKTSRIRPTTNAGLVWAGRRVGPGEDLEQLGVPADQIARWLDEGLAERRKTRAAMRPADAERWLGTRRLSELPPTIAARVIAPAVRHVAGGGAGPPWEAMARAIRIQRGDPIDSALSGTKVRSFFNGFRSGGASPDVVVDRWVVAGAIGKRMPAGWPDGTQVPTVDGGRMSANYAAVAEAIRAVAERRGLGTHDTQAILWYRTMFPKGVPPGFLAVEAPAHVEGWRIVPGLTMDQLTRAQRAGGSRSLLAAIGRWHLLSAGESVAGGARLAAAAAEAA